MIVTVLCFKEDIEISRVRQSVFLVKLRYIGKLDLAEEDFVLVEISVPRKGNGRRSKKLTRSEIVALGGFFCRDLYCLLRGVFPSPLFFYDRERHAQLFMYAITANRIFVRRVGGNGLSLI